MNQNNNMNKFFDSSFFTQTPQKNDKQEGVFTQTQNMFGQTQNGFKTTQSPFMQNESKPNLFDSSTPYRSGNPFQTSGYNNAYTNQQSFLGNKFDPSNSTLSRNTSSVLGNIGSTQSIGISSNQHDPFKTMNKSSTTQPFLSGSSMNQGWNVGGQGGLSDDKSGRTSFLSFRSKNGTRDQPYIQRKIREDNGIEVLLIHINGNENYSDKCIDELRAEDYLLGRKPVTAGKTDESKPLFFTGGFKDTKVSDPYVSFQQWPTSQSNIGMQQSVSEPISYPQTSMVSQQSNIQPEIQIPLQNQTMYPQPSMVQSFPTQFSEIKQPYVINNNIDMSDPFLLKHIEFERPEKKHVPLTKIFPKPIFKEEIKPEKITLKLRPPKQTQRQSIYMIPPIEEIRHMKEIHNLVIGFEEKGRIEYLDVIDASEVNIDNIQSKILFSRKSVIVNDPVGVGLNKKARVYIYGVFAYSKSLGDYIKGEQKSFPLKGIQERFIYQLKNDPTKKFVGYECERGTYVYDVNHF